MAIEDQNRKTNVEQPLSNSNPKNETVQSEKQERGLEQNDHTYEGENDVTHSPEKTGEPKNANANSQGTAQASKESETPKAGYAQGEHDKTPEANPRSANASDPRESDEPTQGTL